MNRDKIKEKVWAIGGNLTAVNHEKEGIVDAVWINRASILELINDVFDDFEKDIAQLKRDREYWKLSFNKQVEASRK